jgi:tetratricopeptide (TPR) repeat protein
VELHLGAARASIAFDAERSLAHAEHALRLSPSSQGALALFADASLANGHAARAATAAERLLQIDPDDGHAIAVLASAWRLAGDSRYRTLYDYANFVRVQTLDTPDGWPDLASWLADLARALHRRHDAMRAHPIAQTLRSGTQVMLHIERDAEPAIRALRDAIGGPIERYLAALGRGTDRLRRRNTGRWQLADFWSVRLRGSGHHFNHYHGSGWLSSACYIELPPLANGQGWLQFGMPCMPTRPALGPDYFVEPEAGQLVLFPSWMWHGTVPFVAKPGMSRLTIAFDVLPA